MAEFNHKFAAHVSSIAFSLTLSKQMVVKLVAIKSMELGCNVFRLMGMPDASVGAGRCLEDRGLVYAPDPEWPGRYELTEAGEHVFALLQMAGMVQRIEAKVTKKETA